MTAVECDRLVETLRAARSRSGLSLAALAAKTPYSKSSWERYLNGKALPPRQAVEDLCVLAGQRPERALALWELADGAWSGRAAAAEPVPVPVADPVPEPVVVDVPGPGRWGRRPVIGIGVLAGVLVLAAVAVALLVGGDDHPRGPAAASVTTAAKGCHGADCTGKDPEAYGCGIDPVPTTLRRRAFPGGTVVKLRHGPDCAAVWARIDLGEVGDRIEIRVPGRRPQQASVEDEFDARGALSTPMAAATRSELDRVTACLVRGGKRWCFGAPVS
ncbi:helix-turn-helix domain-containing protein [Streptomyces sp. KL116D]|uniref:helix-turn-helix domain-containing protein n=1 Tax=Streptomyces sp. KL116D TaxID=3045152 RepID=UPI00355787F4